MHFEGSLYIDTALPFGLRSAPKIFTAVADAVEWVAKREKAGFVIHYLDDFLVAGAPNSPECKRSLETLLGVFSRLGLPVAMEKLEGPTTSLDFLGFTIDSQSMMVQLPPKKLTELTVLLQQWRGRKSCTRRELESLAGKLAHAAKVVQPGKTFMGRIFQLLGGVRQAHHRVRLNLSFRSDIEWWYTFVERWNGVSLMRPSTGARRSVHIWTDASGHFGCGAYAPATGEWIQAQWPHTYAERELQLRDESIALKELLPIVLACGVWGSEWSNQTVVVHCDNMSVVALVNSGYSRVPSIMHILRCLFFIRAQFQLEVWATHVPGVENSLADAISRDNLHLFLLQAPTSSNHRRAIPQDLWRLLTGQQPDWTSQTWTRLFASSFQQASPQPLGGVTSQAPAVTRPSARERRSSVPSQSPREV